LGGGLGDQGIESSRKPAEIEPGEDGADSEAGGEERAVEDQGSDGGKAANEEGEPGDAVFGSGADRRGGLID